MESVVLVPMISEGEVLGVLGRGQQTRWIHRRRRPAPDGLRGSTDRFTHIILVGALAPQTRLLQQDNEGARVAHNLGARNAAGWLLIFLGADMIAALRIGEASTTVFAAKRQPSEGLVP